MKLVSAIMPTRGRPQWAMAALHSFLNQAYPEKQLIILDDSQEPSFELGDIPDIHGIRYLRIDGKETIAKKRNQCCEMAGGELIAHWDSDDWSDPTRLEEQVRSLEESGKSVSGYHSMLFYVDPNYDNHSYYKYQRNPKLAHTYALGTSLCYTQTWWRSHPFQENKVIGEDTDMTKQASAENQIVSTDCRQMMVARVHHGNTSKKYLHGMEYSKVTREDFPSGFFEVY